MKKLVNGVEVELSPDEIVEFNERKIKHEAYLKSEEYKKERLKFLYPPITTQLDMMYWDAINGTTVWIDTITAIKNQ